MIGLVDADLLDHYTSHPNLALMKLAGFLNDNQIPFNLITDASEDVSQYDKIYISKVFTFTSDPKLNDGGKHVPMIKGGTGYYANDPHDFFEYRRSIDMQRLERDSDLYIFEDKATRGHGINMRLQKPYYHLYDSYVNSEIARGMKESRYDNYLNYSIGFLTRGCFRHCDFCVNRASKGVEMYSPLESFLDADRKYMCFWDDNVLALDNDKLYALLDEISKIDKPFQFKQGLDIRLLTKERAMAISKMKYKGDFIFAFDSWKDRDIIERGLNTFRSCCDRSTKLYLFCGYRQKYDNRDRFYNDIVELFYRIEVLMKYKCLGYVMRHENYKESPLPNMYVQVARWVNQPAMYKTKSFYEYVDLCQSMMRTDNECMAKRTVDEFCEMFAEHREEIDRLFNMKYNEK